jgi:hypothetical protein
MGPGVYLWKYNMLRHLSKDHPSWVSQTSDEFKASISISQEEETAMDVPQPQHPDMPSDQLDFLRKRPPTSLPGTPQTIRKRTNAKKFHYAPEDDEVVKDSDMLA